MTQETPQSWFHALATHYVLAQALYHLNRVGVLRALYRREAPASPEQLADELDLSPRPLRVLLEYVHGVDALLTRDALDRYGLSTFGARVLERYGRVDGDGELTVNLFDVRVGAYGPVWAALGGLMRGEPEYGRDVHRAGARAAEATYTISPHMAPTVVRLTRELEAKRLVEIGVPTGLLAYVAPALEDVEAIGLDIDPDALDQARARADAQGVDRIRWVRGDVFDPAPWASAIPGDAPGAFVTVHMHELAAAGLDALSSMLRSLATRFPGWSLFALEQERLPDSARASTPRDLWLYAQSNVLIHHLIGNGQILPRDRWLEVYRAAGCTVRAVVELGYLGYHAHVVQLG